MSPAELYRKLIQKINFLKQAKVDGWPVNDDDMNFLDEVKLYMEERAEETPNESNQ